MKNIKLRRNVPWFIFALLCLWYFVSNKDWEESTILIAFSVIFIILYNKYRKKFVKCEIKDQMEKFKTDMAALIATVLIGVIIFSFINAFTKTVFWLSMVSLAIFIFLSWIITYKLGSFILTEINPKKKSLFFGDLIESIFERTTSLIAFLIVISFFILNTKFYKLNPSFAQVVKIDLPILALLLPTIKMCNFILSEYYDYEKKEQAKQKQQKQEKYKYDFYNYD